MARFVPFAPQAMALWRESDTHHREAHREAMVGFLEQALQDNDPFLNVIAQLPGLDPIAPIQESTK
ncbi:MAG TPA: hypothetical protein DCG16_02850 [Gemmatimonadetes bacterium]|nr:hypothetical protein [Gemmatimonadota bacterium]